VPKGELTFPFEAPSNSEFSYVTNKQIIDLASQVTGLLSAAILYWGSFGVKWEERTIKGTSPRELSVEHWQKHLGWIGLLFAFVAVACHAQRPFRTPSCAA
jgi:hypothetical protein